MIMDKTSIEFCDSRLARSKKYWYSNQEMDLWHWLAAANPLHTRRG